MAHDDASSSTGKAPGLLSRLRSNAGHMLRRTLQSFGAASMAPEPAAAAAVGQSPPNGRQGGPSGRPEGLASHGSMTGSFRGGPQAAVAKSGKSHLLPSRLQSSRMAAAGLDVPAADLEAMQQWP